MDFYAIVKKMAKGEEVSKEEKAFVENFDPGKDENKIPKKRLDDEIAKRKEFEAEVKKLNTSVEEIQGKLDEKDEKDLSEIEKLTKAQEKATKALEKKVTDLTAERDTANGDLSGMKFNSSVVKLAAKHGFKDTEYLSYLVKQKGEDFDFKDEAGSTSFMEDLKKESPKQFTVETKPGAGSGEDGEGSDNDKFVEAKKDGDINAMLANAPEITE